MTAPALVACPVCGYDVPDRPACAWCGWVLSDGPWLGGITARHQRDFDASLAAARRAFDLRAAVLASAGDTPALDRLAGLVRGGRPGATEIATALGTAPPPPATTSIAAAVTPALAALVGAGDAYPPRVLAIVDVRADGVAVARLTVDDIGVPSAVAPVRVTPWHTLVPGLPRDPDACRLVLAGGLGDAARPAAGSVTAPAVDTDDIVVLHRLAGWPLPDLLVRRYPVVHRVSPDEPALGDGLVPALTGMAPLRHGYGLVLVGVDERGTTRPVRLPLFAEGTVAGRHSVATATVTGPAAGREPAVLAVVAGPPDTPPRLCRPVTVARCALPVGERATLEFRLDGPGRVTVLRPSARPDSDAARDWPDLLDDVPDVYQPDVNAVDVVFAVELGGSQKQVDRRRELVTDVIRFVEDHHPEPNAVRVGVIGYGDHRGSGRQPVATMLDLDSPAAARGFVAGLGHSEPVEPRNAPVEDALRIARRGMRWRARPVGRRFVLVGARPPHPAADEGSVARCPNGLTWKKELERLERLEVQHVAVWDRPHWSRNNSQDSRRVEAIWRQLAQPRLTMLLDLVEPAVVARDARVLGTGRQPAPLLFPLIAGTEPREEHS